MTNCNLCGELLPPTSAAAHQCQAPGFNTNTGAAPTTLWGAKCFDCGTAWQAGDPKLPCPTCGGARLYVGIGGRVIDTTVVTPEGFATARTDLAFRIDLCGDRAVQDAWEVFEREHAGLLQRWTDKLKELFDAARDKSTLPAGRDSTQKASAE